MVKKMAKNAITHKLVPEHTKLSEKDKAKLFESMEIGFENLPKILKTDPAINHLEVKQGDVIKIARKSPTAGECLFFRGVV